MWTCLLLKLIARLPNQLLEQDGLLLRLRSNLTCFLYLDLSFLRSFSQGHWIAEAKLTHFDFFRFFPEAEALARELLLDVNPKGYEAAYSVFAVSDKAHLNSLPNLSVPSLFFTADGDTNSTPEMSVAMAALARGGASKVLTGHRHMMTLTAPIEVSATLATFIESSNK